MKAKSNHEEIQDAKLEDFSRLRMNGLPENCMAYSLYIIDSQLKSQEEIRKSLEDVRLESVQMAETLLKSYIWHDESFHLDIHGENEEIYLSGQTIYGDSVEDEWLIVYLLRELSKKFERLWIKVVDTDGEFLLIEAANALPRWLNPEIADNRVWIHNNKLYIIPLCAAHSSSNFGPTTPISRSLRLAESLQILTKKPGILLNPPEIEKEAFYRLRNYPSQISASLHHALIRIPRNLAFILKRIPAAISPAVQAFYLRDPIALKCLQKERSSLLFGPEDLVTFSTRFTKLLFAQLKSQEFKAPPAWRDASVDDLGHGNKYNEQWSLGMKLSCGFEILIRDQHNCKAPIAQKLKGLIKEARENDQTHLLSDTEILRWNNEFGDDDQSWMNIDYHDFEQELSGDYHNKIPHEYDKKCETSGFGDIKTHTDLKKIVERFKSFLDDEKSGLDGAEIDDMDNDDDEEDEEDNSDNNSTDNDDDEEICFDKKEFSRIMREIIEVSSVKVNQASQYDTLNFHENRSVIAGDKNIPSKKDDVNVNKGRTGTNFMEADALKIGKPCSELMVISDKENKVGKQETDDDDEDSEDSEELEEEFDIDFNLAKNLIESFKSQAGLAGPGGNLMGMMGIHLTRDNEEM